jgi:hypothetical protein
MLNFGIIRVDLIYEKPRCWLVWFSTGYALRWWEHA